jgi:hypothetical protein
LRPGQKFRVRAFRQAVNGWTRSNEWLEFLKTQKAVFPSAQGASLILEQKREELPEDYRYVSLDEPSRLPETYKKDRKVSTLDRRYVSQGINIKFDSDYCALGWEANDAFLWFTKVKG